MKFVKFGALALALGMFAASCGNESTATETTTNDTTVTAPEAAPASAETAPSGDTALLINTAGDSTIQAQTTTATQAH